MVAQQRGDKLLIAEIALAVPLRKVFDYRIPTRLREQITPGIRVVVPFGRQKKTGLVIKTKSSTTLAPKKIKSISECIDEQPQINVSLFKLLVWVADYYQSPLGEVFKLALPGIYEPRVTDVELHYELNQSLDLEVIRQSLNKAPKQKELFEYLISNSQFPSTEQIKTFNSSWRRALKLLVDKQIIESRPSKLSWPDYQGDIEPALRLSITQQSVYQSLLSQQYGFNVTLLKGVTGSGKTEIYLQFAAENLKLNKGVLVLVPEISLTPQLINRFECRLGHKAAVLHSGLTAKSRRRAWHAAASGQAKVIIGTRSAVFTAIENLGLIILDEEHDMSYKQQEGVRYHARDVAVMRAKLEKVPILLGSATPSLESLANVMRGRYQLLELNERIGKAVLPEIHLLAMEQLLVKQGLSTTLINAIEKNLTNKQQSLIFINRRGYAPVILCKSCGESLDCNRCHARLTYHGDQTLRCHHCGFEQQDHNVCSHCGCDSLIRLGQGTQRIEAALLKLFPDAKIARLDRDVIRKKDELETMLNEVGKKNIDILVGTQMLSKGHDFPGVTLVGVINTDQGLFGHDFHSTETMVQQLIQVSGRAGRGQKTGKVLIQTDFPEHPLYKYVQQHEYIEFANRELRLRQQSGFPPYRYLALVRSSAIDQQSPLKFLNWIKAIAHDLLKNNAKVTVLDPVFSPMAKRSGRYRAQLLVTSNSRKSRGEFLTEWINLFETDKHTRRVRWSIDIDPLDLY